jgi:hypothetical protein
MSRELPPPYSGDTPIWAEDLNDYLGRARSTLGYLNDDDRAATDGIILWDSAGYPVVSKGGEFRQIVLEGGEGTLSINSDFEFESDDIGYPLTYTAGPDLHGITLNGSQIEFEEAGHYLLSFTAQIYSESAATVDFVFWAKINGTNVPNSTIHSTLHQNESALVIGRTISLTVDADDYLQAFGAVSNTQGLLKAFPANFISTEPAAPASTLSITRLHQ